MNTETTTLLILSVLSYGVRRWLSGVGNATFYAKKSSNENHPLLRTFIQNLHALETPQWYSHSAGHFFAYLVIFRQAITIESGFVNWLVCIGLSTLLVLSGSAIASPFFQGYINIANGKAFIDTQENKKSEFNFFGLFSFWWPRPFVGFWRYVMILFGLVYFLAAFYIVSNF